MELFLSPYGIIFQLGNFLLFLSIFPNGPAARSSLPLGGFGLWVGKIMEISVS